MAVEEVNIERWVEAADNDTQKEFREAAYTILAAIAEEKIYARTWCLRAAFCWQFGITAIATPRILTSRRTATRETV